MGTVHYLRSSDRHRRPTNRRRRAGGGSKERPRPGLRRETSELRNTVIPFPAHRTALGRTEASSRTEPVRARKERHRPILVMLALGLAAFGLAGMHEQAWFSYLEVVLGVLGLIEAGSRVTFSRGRRFLLGWGAQAVAIGAWLEGARSYALLWTIAFGLAFVASARKRRSRPSFIDRP